MNKNNSGICLIVFVLLLSIYGCKKNLKDNELELSYNTEEALAYLNAVRSSPSSYSTELGVDLSNVQPLHNLIWNDTLAKVALEKARDMASRDYFAHVDPDGNGINIRIQEAGYELDNLFLLQRSQNNFESLSAGDANPLDAIKTLIIDKGIVPPGHRIHLLGIEPFWADCYDIGIGFVKGEKKSTYGSYCCVLIAKHN